MKVKTFFDRLHLAIGEKCTKEYINICLCILTKEGLAQDTLRKSLYTVQSYIRELSKAEKYQKCTISKAIVYGDRTVYAKDFDELSLDTISYAIDNKNAYDYSHALLLAYGLLNKRKQTLETEGKQADDCLLILTNAGIDRVKETKILKVFSAIDSEDIQKVLLVDAHSICIEMTKYFLENGEIINIDDYMGEKDAYTN